MTKNEESNLAGCLESVAWSDDIHVLDSFSTDKTVAIAEQFGASVTFRAFDNFGAHQNWGFANCQFRHPWVFYIDADERCTSELANALATAVATPGEYVAFDVERRDYFMGRWLRHVQVTKCYQRLFRPEKMRFERLVHCVSKPQGPVGRLSGYLDHDPFSKGLADWFARHNLYSSQEAEQYWMEKNDNERFSVWTAFFGKSATERRRHLKGVFYRLPARPIAKFVYLVFWRRGFLDGRAGWNYAILLAIYEEMIVLKTKELARDQQHRDKLRSSDLAG